ncbi:NfeD family protein [Marinicella sp. S1101]|uniref:NfeD family protein n=1 Tax=Marinicella marina TaxID=2996016 RepID=UPI0022608E86|nr:NfeD family protein [Marinicella marina]MCX7552869.1 NfeD family protein [Marinicella marina]MDJ1139822.1 NfeD family protein [Marinicella marina]
MGFLLDLTPWHWLTAAVFLLVIEMVVGSYYLLWVSFAAFLVAIIQWMFGISWGSQMVLFSAISVMSVIAWYLYDLKRDKTSTRPNLNKRGHQYIGRTFQLSHPIINGVGKINVDDSTWKVRGDDAPLDTTVKVVDIDGTILIVKILGDK